MSKPDLAAVNNRWLRVWPRIRRVVSWPFPSFLFDFLTDFGDIREVNIKVESNDPDRFVMGVEDMLKKISKNPAAAASVGRLG